MVGKFPYKIDVIVAFSTNLFSHPPFALSFFLLFIVHCCLFFIEYIMCSLSLVCFLSLFETCNVSCSMTFVRGRHLSNFASVLLCVLVCLVTHPNNILRLQPRNKIDTANTSSYSTVGASRLQPHLSRWPRESSALRAKLDFFARRAGMRAAAVPPLATPHTA